MTEESKTLTTHLIPFQSPFLTSSIPQPDALKQHLTSLVQVDPFNRFCLDCHHAHSTHASLTYGIFLCKACSEQHKLLNSAKSVKDVFNDHWDDHQLALVSPEFGGGNKNFFEYLQEYRLAEGSQADKRYKHEACKYYARRLQYCVDQQNMSAFTDKPPTKDWEEKITRAKTAVVGWVVATDKKMLELDKKLQQFGSKIDQDIEKKNWKGKIKNLFKGSSQQNDNSNQQPTATLVSTGAMGDALTQSLEPLKQSQQETDPLSLLGAVGVVASEYPDGIEDEEEEEHPYVLEEDAFEQPHNSKIDQQEEDLSLKQHMF